MRLALNNIEFVKEIILKEEETLYGYFVCLKNAYDSRIYAASEKLPKTVEKFMESKTKEYFTETDLHVHYIYR